MAVIDPTYLELAHRSARAIATQLVPYIDRPNVRAAGDLNDLADRMLVQARELVAALLHVRGQKSALDLYHIATEDNGGELYGCYCAAHAAELGLDEPFPIPVMVRSSGVGSMCIACMQAFLNALHQDIDPHVRITTTHQGDEDDVPTTPPADSD
jgi:hypothetical protein